MQKRGWIDDVAWSYDNVAAPYRELTKNGMEDAPVHLAAIKLFTSVVSTHGGRRVLDAGCGPGGSPRGSRRRVSETSSVSMCRQP